MAKKIAGTVDEAAKALGISRNSAYEGVKQGQIPAIRIGWRWIVLWAVLMKKLGAGD